MKKNNNKELAPDEYFNYIKERKQKITDKELLEFYNGCLLLVEKYKKTGQRQLIHRLRFLIDCVSKERNLILLGINSFVYREDVEEYIDNIASDVVKIIELENYPRDIPDDIVEIINSTKSIFDKYYIVFTDYTGRVEKQVAKTRRDKDPILFGAFQKQISVGNFVLNDKMYYLGDWTDEYCDLTMDKFLQKAGKEKLKELGTPLNVDDIVAELHRLDDRLTPQPVKKSWWHKILHKLGLK